MAAYVAKRVREGKAYLSVDVIKDNLEAVSAREQASKSAAIVIGGGVPKNFIQQIAPMGEVVGMTREAQINTRFGQRVVGTFFAIHVDNIRDAMTTLRLGLSQ